MRLELLYNPRLLCERFAEISLERRRLSKLRGTVAAELKCGHIDSLELLELLGLNPPQVIYDIGANVGTWTLLAKALFPNAKIHAFEPLPLHIQKYREATHILHDVCLHEIGLGSQSECTVMKVTDFSDASSLFSLSDIGKKIWHLEEVEEVPIRIERIDDWIVRNHLPTPDLIKLDVQGFELEILRGATNTLAHTQAVLTEVSFVEIYQGQCLFHELSEHLFKAGFRLVAIAHGTRRPFPLQQTDALFLTIESAAKLYEANNA